MQKEENGVNERFNRSFRDEVLDTHLFPSIKQVQNITWQWMIDHNEQRPYEALNTLTPKDFREKMANQNSSLQLWA